MEKSVRLYMRCRSLSPYSRTHYLRRGEVRVYAEE